MQKPTPQLNVFSISFSLIPILYNHLNIFNALILFKFISAHKFFGIILFRLSAIPPPVMFAQPLIKFFSFNNNNSLTYILVGLINSFLRNLFDLKFIFFFFY